MTEIAKTYKISDVGFRKACIRLNIPIPAVAHWMKVRSGKKILKPKLPATWKGTAFLKLEERAPGEPVSKASEKHKLAKNIAAERLPFKVPDRLTNPDPLIVAARESLYALKDVAYPGMAITDRNQLDIRVAPASIGRALRFMDTLIKCLRARGHYYATDIKGNYVVIRDIRLKVKFRELTSKAKISKPYKDFEWRPNGKLVFRLDGSYRGDWQDLKSQVLEDQLPKILAKLEVVAKLAEADLERARVFHEQWERERKAIAERQARQREELGRFKEMLNTAKRWKQAELLREYLRAIPDPNGEWLSWANHKVNWLDPNINAEDEWMAGVDKNTL
ncbi:hypothetical protein [Mucilaginibacter agri]|uniref:Uncharacterized protein n=1 Tax=Mucilaginibacter agri TaxID=2695265 RepID=A0A965ZDW2_9SPHI|nr:hypothetical protein [Mucilaginibacter agri]NCD67881.1 hypothetical protein [Mucilaginibacter agri]